MLTQKKERKKEKKKQLPTQNSLSDCSAISCGYSDGGNNDDS